MEKVYGVWWMSYDDDENLHPGFERDDCCLIGLYSDREKAEGAVRRSQNLPGFSQYPESFLITEYILNQDNWTHGFSWS